MSAHHDTDITAHAGRFGNRSVVLAFGSGLALALLISGGLIAERLRAGNVQSALLIDAAVLTVSVAVMTLTSRPLRLRFVEVTEDGSQRSAMRLRLSALLLPQLCGALAGVMLAHGVLRQSRADALGWMCECAPQLVNDAVAVLGVLAAIWACATRRVTFASLVAMFALLIWYGATQSHWHVDRAPFPFTTTIQELVVAQVTAVATGLLAFRRFSLA